MQQRVAIARALAYQPRILLMDEPFASVDAQTRADLEDLLLDVWRALGITVLLVTHDIDEAVYLAAPGPGPVASRPTSSEIDRRRPAAPARPAGHQGSAPVRRAALARPRQPADPRARRVRAGLPPLPLTAPPRRKGIPP